VNHDKKIKNQSAKRKIKESAWPMLFKQSAKRLINFGI